MAKTFPQQVSERQRLWILTFLNESAGYRADTRSMQEYLVSRGVGCSLATIADELLWLCDLALTTFDVVEDAMVGQLLQAGKDVAEGLSVVSGIKRTWPKSG